MHVYSWWWSVSSHQFINLIKFKHVWVLEVMFNLLVFDYRKTILLCELASIKHFKRSQSHPTNSHSHIHSAYAPSIPLNKHAPGLVYGH